MKPSTSKQVRKKKKKNNNPKPKNETPTETRNWLDLPRDVMIHIFLKLGVIDLLFNAQSVCSLWRKIAKEPQLFRCIDMRNLWDHFDPCEFPPCVNMALEAIDRSCGQLMEFSIMYFGTDEMLERIIRTTSSLKCLRLATCYQVSEKFLIEAVKKLPLLEEVEMCLCSFTKEVIEVVGQSCKGLKSFRLNHQGVVLPASEVTEDCNEEALAIAAHMPELRRLHLFGNSMTNKGLQDILDNCPHLEYLDLRQCFSVDLKGDLRKRCKAIKTLRLPDDSTEDYEFDSTVHHLGSDVEDYEDYESDEDYEYGFLEHDLSDYGCENDYSDGSDHFFFVDQWHL